MVCLHYNTILVVKVFRLQSVISVYAALMLLSMLSSSVMADHRLKIMGSEVVGYMFQRVRSAVPAHLL